MRVIILAAGQGQRLGPITANQPKCLVSIGDSTIVWHQLDNCETAGIEDVVVVTGAFADAVDDEIQRWRDHEPRRLSVASLYNPFYDVANNMISLWAAWPRFDTRLSQRAKRIKGNRAMGTVINVTKASVKSA